ncbi:uncharacterized protein LOC105423807 isoform X2 [Pogonomyrmex barbatus]|uniref:Uncharacterized protein LOC105423807 isoform X2 n=1 Tax=Pogonomyrmex barbatus TaxID=144034 RepID=A0A8N1S5I2_9HYME|nr:uncharacterized protein LOC105423807 isoform X2 [Pogonomyrmex barbatus]XP_025073269.1 uncharacterized protein LOC105423807 isoform X2 [Pogonomyrmex barbatus]
MRVCNTIAFYNHLRLDLATPKFYDDPRLEASETMCSAYLAYHLSNLRNLEKYLGRRIYLKLQTGGPSDGICRKRHKATGICRTKAPKEGQPDSRVKRSQPMRFGLWRELLPPSLPYYCIFDDDLR